MGRSQRHRLNAQGYSSRGFTNAVRRQATKAVPGRDLPGTGPNLADQKTQSMAGAPAVAYVAGPTNLTPISASILNTSAVNTAIGTAFTPTGGQTPYTYAIGANPNNCGVTVVANQLRSTTNPIAATTGAKTFEVVVFDANSKSFKITYTLTLT